MGRSRHAVCVLRWNISGKEVRLIVVSGPNR